MNMLRWGMSACAALLITGGAAVAEDASELAEMKSSMESMKAEMESLRAADAAMNAEKSYVGGAPESLRSRSGKACLKIGGRIRTRYRAQWLQNQANDPDATRFRDRFGLRSARLDFQADFTPDTTAFLRLRLEAASDSQGGVGQGSDGGNGFIDEAWWQWRNICGTGVTLRLGKIQVPFGEQYIGVLPDQGYSDNSGVYGLSPLSPARTTVWTPGAVYGVGPEASYSMGDFTLTAAVFDGNVNSYGEGGGWAAGNTDAQYSAWLNAAVKLDYDPSMLEGLHTSVSFLGVHNYGGATVSGLGANDDSNANYSPYIDVAADYTHGAFNFFVENAMGWNAGRVHPTWQNAGGVTMYSQTFINTLTLGTTYNHSEKLAFTGMFDWGYIGSAKLGHSNDFRATLGAKYDFGNGISVQAAYSHTWSYFAGENDWRNGDEIYMQSVVKF